MRYIDADALKATVLERARTCIRNDGKLQGAYCDVAVLIDEAPAADVAPVVHAKWETVAIAIGDMHKACSHCHVGCNAGLWWDFCPHCGARMDA